MMQPEKKEKNSDKFIRRLDKMMEGKAKTRFCCGVKCESKNKGKLCCNG